MKEEKSYYAIIPANVRYNKELCANAKLLYGEITALTNEKGYCWAQNIYFAELYNVSKKSISRWISQLEKYDYITTKIKYKKGTKVVEQRMVKIVPTYGQNCPEGMDKNVPVNIYTNNINNTKEYIGKNQKPAKSFKDFNPIVQKSFFAIVNLFPEDLKPKTSHEKRKWVKQIDDLWRLDNYHPRKVFLICKKARQDEFWQNQFLTILKLRRRNKEGIKYIDLFNHKFAQHLMNINFEN